MVKIIDLFNIFDLFKEKTLKEYKIHCLNRIKTRKGNSRDLYRISSDGYKNLEEVIIPVIMGFGLKCPIPYYGSGKERYFGKITENVFLWNNSFGWTCKQCAADHIKTCLLYTSPSPRDATLSRMPSSA